MITDMALAMSVAMRVDMPLLPCLLPCRHVFAMACPCLTCLGQGPDMALRWLAHAIDMAAACHRHGTTMPYMALPCPGQALLPWLMHYRHKRNKLAIVSQRFARCLRHGAAVPGKRSVHALAMALP